MLYWVFLFELVEVFPLCPNWHYTRCWNAPVVYRMWCLSLVCHELWWTKTGLRLWHVSKIAGYLKWFSCYHHSIQIENEIKGKLEKESPIESPFWCALLFIPHLPFVIFDFQLDKIIDLRGVYIYPPSIFQWNYSRVHGAILGENMF